MPSLEVGLTPTQFDNILLEFLRDRGVKDLVNALEALRFMYTYWPAPSNNPAVRQQMIDVSFIVRVNLMVLINLMGPTYWPALSGSPVVRQTVDD